MLYHLANHLSTLGERESEESECEKSQNERVTRASLSHLQRQPLAQEVGVMHQVSYSSFVSIFCQNEIKDWIIIRASKSIFSFPFLFQKKKKNGLTPYACHFRWKFSTAPLLYDSMEKK